MWIVYVWIVEDGWGRCTMVMYFLSGDIWRLLLRFPVTWSLCTICSHDEGRYSNYSIIPHSCVPITEGGVIYTVCDWFLGNGDKQQPMRWWPEDVTPDLWIEMFVGSGQPIGDECPLLSGGMSRWPLCRTFSDVTRIRSSSSSVLRMCIRDFCHSGGYISVVLAVSL